MEPTDYADMSLNPPRDFFLFLFQFLQSTLTLLTPGRLKPATLHAWGVSTGFENISYIIQNRCILQALNIQVRNSKGIYSWKHHIDNTLENDLDYFVNIV